MQSPPFDEPSIDVDTFRPAPEPNSVSSRRNIYRKPKPSRIGWQLLTLEQPIGGGGAHVGAAVDALKLIAPIVARGESRGLKDFGAKNVECSAVL